MTGGLLVVEWGGRRFLARVCAYGVAVIVGAEITGTGPDGDEGEIEKEKTDAR